MKAEEAELENATAVPEMTITVSLYTNRTAGSGSHPDSSVQSEEL